MIANPPTNCGIVGAECAKRRQSPSEAFSARPA